MSVENLRDLYYQRQAAKKRREREIRFDRRIKWLANMIDVSIRDGAIDERDEIARLVRRGHLSIRGKI